MSTIIRPELSQNNKYWIERHRYYELKHFCLQFNSWKKSIEALEGFSKRPVNMEFIPSYVSDPTARTAMAKLFYSNRLRMVEQVCRETDEELAPYILKGVTQGASYDTLNAKIAIPCCKDVYYDTYRKFFWLLDKARK